MRLSFVVSLWVVLVGVVWTSPAKRSYAGYSLLRTDPLEREDLAQSLLILDGAHGIHFWKYPLLNASSDILASPSQIGKVRSLLDTLGVRHSTLISDVNDLLEDENPQVYDANGVDDDEDDSFDVGRATSTAFFQRYQRYDAIMTFVKSLAREDPTRVTYESVGTSTEGREIVVVKVSSGPNKPAIWIDGGMHAREWISPATATYMLYKLVKDPNSKQLLEMFDFYVVPIINVDGYEFTHTGDRMWRKTRSRGSGRRCVGVDPNRNWGFHWAEGGSSTDPCSDIYHGPNAFSEPETLSVARAIKARRNIKLYLTLHSYSQLWLIPYGYKKYAYPPDYNELLQLAQVGKTALSNTYGTQYRVGTAPDLLYPAAGGSDDWAKGAAGIKYSYCLELRDSGRYGFLLPASQIMPTGEETFNGLKAMAQALSKKLGASPLSTGPYVNADKELNSPNGGF